MPELLFIFGYVIYITSFDKNEPFHVHLISRKNLHGRRGKTNSSKLWLGKFGEVKLAHNNAHIPERELMWIIKAIKRDKKIYNDIVKNYCEFLKITSEQVNYYKNLEKGLKDDKRA